MRIYLNSKELLFDGKLTVNSSHPFLGNDNERIDNIFSLGVPITGNEATLNYAYDIDALVNREFACDIIGMSNFTGVAIISEVSSEDNTVTLQIGYSKSNFNYLIKDKLLKEFDFGKMQCRSSLKTSCLKQNIQWNYSQTNYYEKTYMTYIEGNQNYFANQGIYFAKKESIKLKIHVQVSFSNVMELKLMVGRDNATNVVFIQKGKKNAGLAIDTYVNVTINGNEGETHYIWLYGAPFTEDSAFTIQYLIYNVEATINSSFLIGVNDKSYPEANYCFPLIKNEKLIDFLPAFKNKEYYQKYPYMNEIFTNDYSLTRQITSTFSISKFISPSIYVAHIIDIIFKSLGYMIKENVFATQLNKLIVFNAYIMGYYTMINNNLSLVLPEEYQLSNAFDNGITIKEFLNSLSVVTGYFPIFDHNAKNVEFVNIRDLQRQITHIDCMLIDSTIEFDAEEKGIEIEIDKGSDNFIGNNTSIEDYTYKGSVATLGSLDRRGTKLNDCFYVEDERKYYAYLYEEGFAAWKFVAYDYRIKASQGAEKFVSIKSDIPILVGISTELNNQANNLINIPVTEQPIKIQGCYESVNNKWSNSFMFVRGLKTKDGLGEYLYASADVYYGNAIESDKSLRIDGEFGLLNRIYSALANVYENGIKQNITVLMKQEELRKLTYKNLIDINNSTNILLSYKYVQDESELIQVELELIKI